MQKLLFIFSSIIIFLSGCKKEINLHLDDKSGNVVIEGNVTDQPGPYYVFVRKSVAFTENNQYPAITDATVIISDNTGQKDTLQYDTDGRYKTTHLTSTPGNTYTLTVITNGTAYTANSTLPQPVVLDSLKQDSLTFGGKVIYNFLPVFTDSSMLGNYYRFKLTVNGVLNDAANLFSDDTNNGLQNERVLFASDDATNDNDDLKKGDLITVEMQCVDEPVYRYYTALAQISGSGGFGGGVTPSNPPGNISNNVLGYFSAHTVAVKSIIIK